MARVRGRWSGKWRLVGSPPSMTSLRNRSRFHLVDVVLYSTLSFGLGHEVGGKALRHPFFAVDRIAIGSGVSASSSPMMDAFSMILNSIQHVLPSVRRFAALHPVLRHLSEKDSTIVEPVDNSRIREV